MNAKVFFLTLLGINLTFGQNRSLGGVNPALTITAPAAPNEIFRFQSGNVTQLDAGTGFGFTSSDRWFSLGKVVTGTNTAYGLRFQNGQKAVTFGYQSIASNNPRIEWIGTNGNLGDLEFRSSSSFTSTTSNLLATLTSDGRTIFGSVVPGLGINSKLFIESDKITGLSLQPKTGSNVRLGILVNASNSSDSATGILSQATCSDCPEIGVRGNTTGLGDFQAGIYGDTPSGSGEWAGYFNGDVFVSGTFTNPSDAKFKENVKQEMNVLSKIELLKPVSYNYKQTKEINLAKELQHGFIAQEIEKIFPELTKEVVKPIFDKEGNVTSKINFKSVNYNGMISILTQAVKELHTEIKALQDEIAALKDNKSTEKASRETSENGIWMNQNVPNPFKDQTSIRYKIPTTTSNATLLVLNLNGALVKTIPLNPKANEVIILSSEIGKGLFLYSLVINGEEQITKKMVVQ